MDVSRRDFVTVGMTGLLATQILKPSISKGDVSTPPQTGERNKDGYVPCIAPGIPTLAYKWDGSTKLFNLVAEPVTVEWQDMSDPHGAATRPIYCWGYNGSMIGPTIEVVEGDTVRVILQNNLPDPTTVHWHGLHIPLPMDGVPDLSQPMVMPGESFTYEFTLEQSGTYFYHSHVMQAKQVAMGLLGFFIIHPKKPEPWQVVDRDYAYFLQTWKIGPRHGNPDNMEMSDFNYFTMNGRPGNGQPGGPKNPAGIVPMQARSGEKVRIRVGNLSMLTHPIHLHGHTFKVTDWGGGFLPQHQHIAANTIDVSNAEVRVLEFEASKRLGKWLFHCHFMHHTMNDMHRRPIPGMMPHAMHVDGGMHTWIEII